MSTNNNPIASKIGATISGVTNTFTVTNPSNTASSAARKIISVGGASAGDPALNFNVSGVTDFTMGIDNNDSDNFKLAASTALGTTDTVSVTTAGEHTLPLQPSFMAYTSGVIPNVTGDGTQYTIVFGTEAFDRGGDFDGTSTFTCPVDGVYLLSASVAIEDITSAHTLGFIIINADFNYVIWDGSPAACRSSDTTLHVSGSVIGEFTAGTTCDVRVQVENGALGVGIRSGRACRFQGCLLA